MNQGRIFGVICAVLLATSPLANALDYPAVPGEYVVKLKNTKSIMRAGLLEAALGVRIKETINARESLILVQRPVVESAESAIQTLASNSMVGYVEPNYIYTVVGGATNLPNDPKLDQLWGMINTGQSVSGDMGTLTGVPGVDIDAKRAWQIETGSQDIRVAVIDTGVNYSNPDLAANIYTNEAELNGQTGVDDDSNGCVDDIYGCDFARNDGDPMDVYGHGTHVSGTIGAIGNNGEGVVGVAWNVTIIPVRFLDDNGGGTLANAVKSIDYATAMGADIMSNSWGGGGFSQALMDSIVRAKDAGILFVAAAGNDGADNDIRATYPANYDVDNVIAVAAIGSNGRLASFSNYGKTKVHIAAPGVNVLSYTMRGLESWSGTSMATPHVSGVAALLLSQDATQSYSVIKERLLASARPMSSLRNRVVTGMLNAYHALGNTTAPGDPNDPFYWEKSVEQVSTPHQYPDDYVQEYELSVPGAARIAVHFSRFDTEAGYDKVEFINSQGAVVDTLSGNLGDTYGPIIEGDTVKLRFTTDGSVQRYGFDIDGVAYQ